MSFNTRELSSELDTLKELFAIIKPMMPLTTYGNIIMDDIWIYRPVGHPWSLKLIIKDASGDVQGFEGPLIDFSGCRNATELMIRALGG